MRAKGDLAGALGDFTEAIKLNPDYARAFADRGSVRLTQHDLDGAIADLDTAIRLDPNDAGAFMTRGNAFDEKADFDRAIADYNEAIRSVAELCRRLFQSRARVSPQRRLRSCDRRLRSGHQARPEERLGAEQSRHRLVRERRFRPRHRRLQSGAARSTRILRRPITIAATPGAPRAIPRARSRISIAPSSYHRNSRWLTTIAASSTIRSGTIDHAIADFRRGDPLRSEQRRRLQQPRQRPRRQGRPQCRHCRLQRGDPPRSQERALLLRSRHRLPPRWRPRPRHRRFERGHPDSIRSTPAPITSAAMPSIRSTISSAPFPTTIRRSSSIRNSPSPTTIAATPSMTRAIPIAPSPTTTRRCASIRATRRRSTIAASPGGAKATSIGRLPTTIRRSSSIPRRRPTTTAAAPGSPRARAIGPSPIWIRPSSSIRAWPTPTSIAATPSANGSISMRRIADYTRAIELAPNAALAFYNRAWAHYLAGENVQALADADRAITLNAHSASAFSTRGLIRERLADTGRRHCRLPQSTRDRSFIPAARRRFAAA